MKLTINGCLLQEFCFLFFCCKGFQCFDSYISSSARRIPHTFVNSTKLTWSKTSSDSMVGSDNTLTYINNSLAIYNILLLDDYTNSPLKHNRQYNETCSWYHNYGFKCLMIYYTNWIWWRSISLYFFCASCSYKTLVSSLGVQYIFSSVKKKSSLNFDVSSEEYCDNESNTSPLLVINRITFN